MPAATTAHHHRSTTKVSHKPFKSRHATKSDLRDRSKGRIEPTTRQNKQQIVYSKFDRKNRAKQLRQNNHAQHVKAASVFAGRDGAPRIVAVVPLCDGVNAVETVKALNAAADFEDAEWDGRRVWIERFKQNVAYLTVQREMIDVLDACRMADFVVLVMAANTEVDELGETLLRAAESQGISNVLVVAQGIETLPTPKKKQQTIASLRTYITHFFPTVEKINSLRSKQECQNVLRMICTSQPRGIHWREDRSWMMVEEVRWPLGKAVADESGVGGVVLTGVIRGRGLKADRLVQVGDWGDFQIEKVEAAPTAKIKKHKDETMVTDMDGLAELLEVPTEDQDDLEDLAPEEVMMEDADFLTTASTNPTERKGVLIDDHYYYPDEEKFEPVKATRLPRGTSTYQAAWYLGDDSDSGSDMEDVEEPELDGGDPSVQDPADGPMEIDMRDPTEAGGTEYAQSEAFLDPSPAEEAEQIAEYRRQRHLDVEEDLEFPDEVELEPTALARERLLRYRGLKNARTSLWDTGEDRAHEPDEWRRLLEIGNYKAAKNRTLKEGFFGGVQPGTRVKVFLKDVPLSFQTIHDSTKPLAMYSLLRHEHKRTAVNYSITLTSALEAPLKSKQEIIAQCGSRRFIINPLYSDDANTPNDVHKFKRFLHPGQSAVASFNGPLTWGAVPVLYFRHVGPDSSAEMDIDSPSSAPRLEFIGTGTSLAPSHTRVIAKRLILTGHPYKIHRKVVTVRYMFFNAEDVAWFKALRLWTKRGRSGFIKQSLGTHGYFKATFDGKIDPQDAVAVSLYKRVWPRTARMFEVLPAAAE